MSVQDKLKKYIKIIDHPLLEIKEMTHIHPIKWEL